MLGQDSKYVIVTDHVTQSMRSALFKLLVFGLTQTERDFGG